MNKRWMIVAGACGLMVLVLLAKHLRSADSRGAAAPKALEALTSTPRAAPVDKIANGGIPRDMAAAVALAHKKDDRLRKEFEKWAALTYTSNRAVINEKKGAT